MDLHSLRSVGCSTVHVHLQPLTTISPGVSREQLSHRTRFSFFLWVPGNRGRRIFSGELNFSASAESAIVTDLAGGLDLLSRGPCGAVDAIPISAMGHTRRQRDAALRRETLNDAFSTRGTFPGADLALVAGHCALEDGIVVLIRPDPSPATYGAVCLPTLLHVNVILVRSGLNARRIIRESWDRVFQFNV